MAKKTLLRLDFESEYRIVGLFCNENDYRLCWLLNRYLLFSFKRGPDMELLNEKTGIKTNFSVFEYQAPESLQSSFFIVNNRSHENILLFPAPPGLGFLLMVRADESRYSFKDLLNNLRKVPQLTAAYLLDNILGKNKEAFLYDFEFFVSREIETARKKEEGMWMTAS
jgi:hypothetical protein